MTELSDASPFPFFPTHLSWRSTPGRGAALAHNNPSPQPPFPTRHNTIPREGIDNKRYFSRSAAPQNTITTLLDNHDNRPSPTLEEDDAATIVALVRARDSALLNLSTMLISIFFTLSEDGPDQSRNHFHPLHYFSLYSSRWKKTPSSEKEHECASDSDLLEVQALRDVS